MSLQIECHFQRQLLLQGHEKNSQLIYQRGRHTISVISSINIFFAKCWLTQCNHFDCIQLFSIEFDHVKKPDKLSENQQPWVIRNFT